MKEFMKNDLINLAFKNNDFNRIDNITFYANAGSSEELKGLIMYIKSIEKGKKDKIVYSQRARVNGNYIMLRDGNIQEFDPNNRAEGNTIFFEKYNLRLDDYYNLNVQERNNFFDADFLNIIELLRTKNRDRKTNALVVRQLLNPLISIFLSMLAFGLIFSGEFSRMENEFNMVKTYFFCTVGLAIFLYLFSKLEKKGFSYFFILLYMGILLMGNLILINRKNV
jgi:heme/copper-type cytochrome/quinol oxidase subunit 4